MIKLPFTIIRRAKVGAACGRNYLDIAGIIVAMEGDPCREIWILSQCDDPHERRAFGQNGTWTKERLELAARRINGDRV